MDPDATHDVYVRNRARAGGLHGGGNVEEVSGHCGSEEDIIDDGSGSWNECMEMESFYMRCVRTTLNDFIVAPVGLGNSPIYGRGLFAVEEIARNMFIGESEGERLFSAVDRARERRYRREGVDCYFRNLSSNWGEVGESTSDQQDSGILQNGNVSGNMTGFINHSCNLTCYAEEVEHDSVVIVAIFTLRAIRSGAELTYDYLTRTDHGTAREEGGMQWTSFPRVSFLVATSSSICSCSRSLRFQLRLQCVSTYWKINEHRYWCHLHTLRP